jgi:hypothetical protein
MDYLDFAAQSPFKAPKPMPEIDEVHFARGLVHETLSLLLAIGRGF